MATSLLLRKKTRSDDKVHNFISAHPNCRLFITHGGVLSTTETVHFGVPVIGIPVGYDQHLNINRAVIKGFAKKVTLAHNMAGELKLAIDEVINNPR